MATDLLQVNNHQLYVERHGPAAGPAVVLLHHGLGAVQAWEAQIPALVKAGYQTLAYDRWGYGRSQDRTEFSMPAFIEDRADLQFILAHYGLDQVNLVGHSDGGTIALYYAADNPYQVERLVVIAAHIYVESKMESGINTMCLAYENNVRFRAGLSRLHGQKVDQVLYGWCSGWNHSNALTWDMRSLLSEITCPVLVIQGEDDEHATSTHASDLAQALPNAELWLEAGVGHMLPQDRPELFNRKLLAFLKA